MWHIRLNCYLLYVINGLVVLVSVLTIASLASFGFQLSIHPGPSEVISLGIVFIDYYGILKDQPKISSKVKFVDLEGHEDNLVLKDEKFAVFKSDTLNEQEKSNQTKED